MQDKKIEKVLSVYNDYLKRIRDEYLSSKGVPGYYRYILLFAPILICLLFILLFKISISMLVILMIVIIVVYVIVWFFKKDKSYQTMNAYLMYLKKCGFSSIDEFEGVLNKYILGDGNYSIQLLNHYISEYGIDENTNVIMDLDKVKYYVWCDQNYFYLLPINSPFLNILKKIKIGDIYYFRKDKISTIIKCASDVLLFDIFAYDKINSLIGDKKYENIINFEPDNYISDFELYMHNYKEDNSLKFADMYNNGGIYFKVLISIVLIICLSACFILFNIPSVFITKICLFVLFVWLCFSLNKLTDLLSFDKLSEDKVLMDAVNDPKTNLMFRELKVALSIYDDYDKVYTNTGACYLCWVKNGYFHVFLNQIYYNCVYMVIGLKDIDYYYLNKNELVLKSKVKTLSFRTDAKELFDKILPNKDYAWLNGLKNK